jgi:hypothetical protein
VRAVAVKLVIVAPYYEPATFIWSPYLKGWVADNLRVRCVEPVVLWGNDAVPDKFAQALKDPDVKGVLGVGHGSEDEFTGQGYSVLVKVGMLVPQEWKDDVFAPVSCLVGQRLVPYLVQQGVPAGIGEVTEYWFTAVGTGDGSDPEQDPLLKFFMYAEYTFWFKLAEGATAGEAYDAMIAEYKRQADQARQVDPTTWWCLQTDWQNRQFFGDRSYRLPAPGGRVSTSVRVSVSGERKPLEKEDEVAVSGTVAAEDGATPQGSVKVKVVREDGVEQEETARLDGKGSFTVTFTFPWDINIDLKYTVTVTYLGWRTEAKCYLPSAATATLTVKGAKAPTVTKITRLEAKREGDTVHLLVEGVVTTSEGEPVPSGVVEVVATDTYPFKGYARTDQEGKFALKTDVAVGWFDTTLSVTACYKGDDLRMPSCDEKLAKYPPNWKVVAEMAGAAAAIIILIIAAVIAGA